MSVAPANKTILVVDDEDASRYTLTRYLKAAGFNVREAKTGREALAGSRELPSLVILDIGLPDMLGFDVCRQLKADPLTAAIPVLHTSANFTSGQNKAAGLDGGADGYLTSPVQPDELLATVRSLLRLREAEAQARELSRQWQTTFDAISDGICLVSSSGEILRHNRAFAAIFARSDAQLAGQSVMQLLQTAAVPETPLPRMLQTRGREVFETHLGDRYFRVIIEPVMVAGETASAVCSLQDITAQKHSELELRAAQEKLRDYASNLEVKVAGRTAELKETVQSLQSFYYSIAHDLQAPLRNIQSFTTLLDDQYGKALDATGQDYVRRVGASAGRMSELLKDLVAYGQVAHTRAVIKEVDLNQAVADARELLRSGIMEKNAVIRLDEKPWPLVWSNPTLLSQVLVNLLENALKFVKDGPPEISIRGEVAGEDFRLWVEDNGIGIQKEHHERIFHIFERLHSDELVFPGNGMGLAIVRKAVERMGGKVGVESTPHKGAKFWLKFKLASIAAPAERDSPNLELSSLSPFDSDIAPVTPDH